MSPRAPRSAATIGLGAFLVLAAGALVLVIVAGDRAPLWMIGAWFFLAAAIALIVGAAVPTPPRRDPRDASRGSGPEER